MNFKNEWKRHVKSVLMLTVLILTLYSTFRIANNLVNNSLLQLTTGILVLNYSVYMVVILLLISLIHCVLHYLVREMITGGLFKKRRAADNNLCESNHLTLSRNHYALIILLPLAIISIVCTFIRGWTGQLFFIGNILVSLGDIYELFEVNIISVKNRTKTEDLDNGSDMIEINI